MVCLCKTLVSLYLSITSWGNLCILVSCLSCQVCTRNSECKSWTLQALLWNVKCRDYRTVTLRFKPWSSPFTGSQHDACIYKLEQSSLHGTVVKKHLYFKSFWKTKKKKRNTTNMVVLFSLLLIFLRMFAVCLPQVLSSARLIIALKFHKAHLAFLEK